MVRVPKLVLALSLLAPLLSAQIDAGADAYNFAAGLHDRGLYERAARSFEDFLKKWPSHPKTAPARFYLGQSLAQLGKEKEALAALEKALDDDLGDLAAQAHLRAGELAQRLDRHDQAIRHLAPLVEGKQPGSVREPALYFLAEARSARGAKEEARRTYVRQVREFPKGRYAAYGHSALGFLTFEAKDLGKARLHFLRAADAAGTDGDLKVEALTMAGECHLGLNDPARAQETFEGVLAEGAGEQDLQARLGLARALLAQKRPDAAASAFKDLARRHPEDARTAKALIRAGVQLHEQGEHQRGLDMLQLVRGAKGKDAEDLAYWSGRLLEATGKTEDGIAKLRLAAGSSPKRKFSLGDALSRSGRFQEAADVFADLRQEAKDGGLLAEAAFAEAFARNRLEQYGEAVAILKTIGKGALKEDLARDRDFAMGENLFALKRFDAALPWYARVVKRGAGRYHSDALYKSGWCAWLLGRPEPALHAFQELVSRDPQSAFVPEARYLMAKCQESLGRTADARASFEKLANDSKAGDLKVRSLLGAAATARSRKDADAAIQAYEQSLSASPTDAQKAQALLALGDVRFEKGDFEEALQAYGRLLDECPEDPGRVAARLGRAWALRELGRHPQAITDASTVVREARDDKLHGEACFLLGMEQQEQGDHAAAARAFGQLLERHPDHERFTEARLAMGVSLARSSEFAGASKALEAVVAAGKDTPGHDVALYELAFCREQAKDLKGRDAAFALIVKQHPDSDLVPDSLFRLGESSYAAKHYEQALGHYRALFGHAKVGALKDKAAYKGGWCLRKLDRHAEAAAAFAEVTRISKSPLASESCYLAGDEYAEAGNDAEATRFFALMVEQHADHELATDAGLRRVLGLSRQGRQDDVIRTAPEALREAADQPRAVSVWSALADAFFVKQQWGRARTAYKKVTTLSEGPLAARAQYRIGRSYTREDQLERATDELLKVVILYAHPEWVRKASLEAGTLLEKSGQHAKARRILEELVRDHPKSAEAAEARRLIASKKQ